MTFPWIVPVPPSTAPELTVTPPVPVPLPVKLFTSSVPPATVVPPVYELAPDEGASVKTPEPVLVSPPAPLNTPPKIVELLLPPAGGLAESETVPPGGTPPDN